MNLEANSMQRLKSLVNLKEHDMRKQFTPPSRMVSARLALLASALAVSPTLTNAQAASFAFSTTLLTPMQSVIWFQNLQTGATSGIGAPAPTSELSALRVANPSLSGTFGWNTAQIGTPSGNAKRYSGSFALDVQQGGTSTTISNSAMNVFVSDADPGRDYVALSWNVFNNVNNGVLDITTSQPVETVVNLNIHFSTGLPALPVRVTYGNLRFAALTLVAQDSTRQAFSSDQLPSTLALEDFDSSYLEMGFVGQTSFEVRAQDFATAAQHQAAVAFVQANVSFQYVQFSFTGLPYPPLTQLSTVSQVPEPQAWALWVAGLGAVAGAAARRRRNQRRPLHEAGSL